MAASIHVIEAVKHTVFKGWGNTAAGTYSPFTSLIVEFEVKDPGPSHVSGIYYTTDFWKKRETAYAECVRVEGPYGPGGKEKWVVHLELPTHGIRLIEYLVFSIDPHDPEQIKTLYQNRSGELFQAKLEDVVPADREPSLVHARASSLNARGSRPSTGGVAVRPVTPATIDTTTRPKARISTASGQLAGNAFTPLCPYLTILMLRNFATNTWQFKADGKVSKPGCIIASPSRPEDPCTDQDYVNSWLRDSALCIQEAGQADLPWTRMDLLDDYVSFSRLTQQNAKGENDPGHACFHIDGSIRPWGSQSDGPALRVMAILDFWIKLSDAGRAVAKPLVEEDLAYLLGAYEQKTTNLWEEAQGLHFFTRAVQKRCFERVLAEAPNLGLNVNLAAVQAAATKLANQLEDHWSNNHYRSTLQGGGPGCDVDSSTVMGAVYGNLKTTEPRLLSNAAVVWDSFRTLYGVNHWDNSQGLGPVIGRYPEDQYDGDMSEMPNIGHPWPLCTALFAEYYYRAARQLKLDGSVKVDALSRRFYQQIEFTPADGNYAAGSPEFGQALEKLEAAGDRMLGAVLYHSDNLELSEQYDRYSGFEKSVRNLTWSYATFLSAVRAKQRI